MKKILEVKKEIGNLSKNSKNPFFKSAYLDLNDLLNAVEPLLQKNGLVLLQPIIGNSVQSVIYEAESGNRVCISSMNIPENITDPQKLGSCITYFRRYTLKSLLAIAETDDDGNMAAKPKEKVEAKEDPFVLKEKHLKEWNGKIYGRDEIFIAGEKRALPKETIAKLKLNPKFDKSSNK
jgi:hypothetical protein